MDFTFLLIAAAAGGFFAACIGGNFSFVMVGFTLMAAIGAHAAGAVTMASDLFSYVAFGPFTGPHIAFAGAVGASGYAASRGYTENGKDIAQPLARLGKPDVLLVGAAFGVFGLLCKTVVDLIPWFGHNTDSVALTVVISAILNRFVFGDRSLLNPEHYNTNGNKFAPHEGSQWVRYQEKPSQLLALGIFTGILAAAVSIVLAVHFPAIGMNAQTFVFGISAISIFFLNIGYNSPVTHHMTIIGGLAGIVFYQILGGHPAIAATNFAAIGWNPGVAVGAVLIGAAFATVSAFLGELFARLFQSRGKTHIDPPAFAIFTSTTIVWIVAALVGATH